MSASAPCLTIGQLCGSYRVVRALGEGAMGEVYEVYDSALDRRAALKVVPPSMARDKGVVARFHREARAASQVRHAGVVHIFEYGVLPAPLCTPYFIMEHLEGETLHTRVRRAARQGGCLGLSCLPILRQVAIALSAVHRRGLVHRDLKPANVMLVADPTLPGGERAKLLDFGIVKSLQAPEPSPADSQECATRQGLVLGTPRYMAPEQWKCGGRVEGKTDVYALGVMTFLGLSGELPFDAKDAPELGMMHCYKVAPSLASLNPTLPPVVVELVARMLEKDPERRPTMATVAETLGRLLPRQGLFEKVAGFLGTSDVEISVEPSGESTNRGEGEKVPLEENPAELTQPLAQIFERPTRRMSLVPLPLYSHPEFSSHPFNDPSSGSLLVGSNDNLRVPSSFGSWLARGAAAVVVIAAVYFMINMRPSRSVELDAAVPAVTPRLPSPSPSLSLSPPPPLVSRALEPAGQNLLPPPTSKRHLVRRVPSASCITNPGWRIDQQQLLLRAFVRSDAKLYPQETLVLTHLTDAPQLQSAPKSMSRHRRAELLSELRRIQGHFAPGIPARIELRCP